MKIFFGIFLSALSTFVVACIFLSFELGSKGVNPDFIDAVQFLNSLSVHALDVGFFKFLIIAAPILGVVSSIVKIAASPEDSKNSSCLVNFNSNFNLPAKPTFSSVLSMLKSLFGNVFDGISAFVPILCSLVGNVIDGIAAFILRLIGNFHRGIYNFLEYFFRKDFNILFDDIIDWIFLKFSISIVGAFVGFALAYYYYGRIGFYNLLLFLAYSPFVYLVIWVTFKHYIYIHELGRCGFFMSILLGLALILLAAWALG